MGNVYDAMQRHESEHPDGAAAGGPDAPGRSDADQDPADAAGSGEPLSRPQRVRPHTNGYAPELVAHSDRGGRLAEEYRALRTNLLAQYEKHRFCILVTSAEAAEGKTITCLNLGFVLAELPDRRTVVVDCDLQKSDFNALVGIPPTPGVADVLRGNATPEQALHATTYNNMFVMPAGVVDQAEVGELLSRPELEDLVTALRKEYDYVLLDTPPIRVAGVKRRYRQSVSYSTAGILGRTAKDALLVVRMNKTRRESVEAAIRQLHTANVRPVGLVLTHQRHYIPGPLYRLF